MKTFEELGIKKSLNYLKEAGFTEPFPIQESVIPILLKGKDVIGQAQTGTGKTAAFGLPILEGIDENIRDTQALIIVPTRELAMQVADEMKKFSGGTAKVTAVFGGENMLRQIRFLKEARQVVVATPGRMLDYIKEDIMPLNKVRFVVLDEADRMLDMGFIEDVKEILRHVPDSRQMSMFSATMPPAIITLAREFMRNPEKIIVSKDEISNVDVQQFYMEMHDRDKLLQICNLLKDNKKTIVFCAAKIRVKRLAEDLHKRGFEVEAIHGDMEQPQRTRVIGDFKWGRVNILIATDVVARGIDVPTVERVVSYDVPNEAMVYFHRIGRTARAGKTGNAIIFVTKEYRKEFDAIRNETKIHIERIPTPTVQDFPIVRTGGKSFSGSNRFAGGGRGFYRRDSHHGHDRDSRRGGNRSFGRDNREFRRDDRKFSRDGDRSERSDRPRSLDHKPGYSGRPSRGRRKFNRRWK